ncbi:hypothetical protein [Vibrio genomosp. F10]|uniref:SLAC1 family transporter n=2 Tax=Vibrio genomosp. F10 TaxID=723171 RepID=UPI001F51AE43|nr:hypothetical protein [Vibrio genomosp. F10]
MMTSNTLLRLPIALVSASMGVSGLATGIQASQLVFIKPLIIPLASLAAFILTVMILSMIARMAFDAKGLKDEVRVATKRNFFACSTITIFLLSGLVREHEVYQTALWLVGTVIQVPLLLAILIGWGIYKEKTLTELNPTFLIPPLANVVCSIFSPVEYIGISHLMYFTGMLIGIVVYIAILVKTLQGKAPPVPLYPTFFIGLATPSMLLLGYLKIVGFTDRIAAGMYVWSLLIIVALAINMKKFEGMKFGVSTWAFTFPLAAFSTATYRLGLFTVGHFFLSATCLVVVYVAIKTATNLKIILNP